jgi:hypothetical protein
MFKQELLGMSSSVAPVVVTVGTVTRKTASMMIREASLLV